MGGRVDRSAKRPLLIGANLFRAALLFTVPLAHWIGLLSMLQLYAVAAGVGAASTLFQIADNAYLPALVGKPHLVDANAKLETTDAVAEIGGPSIAGILIEIVTAPVAIVFDAISFVVSAVFIKSIRGPEVPAEVEAEPPSLARDLATGTAGRIWPSDVASVVPGRGLFALYMIFTIDTVGLSPGIVGLLIGLGGVGGLLGALFARRLPIWLGLGPAMIVLVGLGQAAWLLIAVASGPDWLVIGLLAAHQLVGDALLVAYTIHAVSLRQTVLPMSVLGRANATLHALTSLLLPLGALVAGALASLIGVRETIWLAFLGGLLAPFILAASPVRSLEAMPEAAEPRP